MDKSKFENKKEWQKFGIGLGFILGVIGTLQLIFDKELYFYFYITALIIFLSSLFFPILLKPLFISFSYLGFGIGWLTTQLVLILLFYFLFTSLGFLLKLFGKDFLRLKKNRKINSYWIERKTTRFDKENYEAQF